MKKEEAAPVKRNKDGSERRSTKNRLTKDQWDELLLKLMSGKYTQRQLAKEYEVSVQSIIQKRRKTDTKIGDVAPQNKTIENAKKEAQSSNVATRLSLEDSGKLIADAKLTTFERIDMLGKLTGDLLKKAWLGGNIQGIGKDIKVLLDVQTMFEKEIRLKGICLGFPEGQFGIDESSLTVLTVNRMSDEEVQQAQDSLDDDDEWGDDYIESGDEEDEEG
jgi:hypothetical protein